MTAKGDNKEIYSFSIIKLGKKDMRTPQVMTPQSMSMKSVMSQSVGLGFQTNHGNNGNTGHATTAPTTQS